MKEKKKQNANQNTTTKQSVTTRNAKKGVRARSKPGRKKRKRSKINKAADQGQNDKSVERFKKPPTARNQLRVRHVQRNNPPLRILHSLTNPDTPPADDDKSQVSDRSSSAGSARNAPEMTPDEITSPTNPSIHFSSEKVQAEISSQKTVRRVQDRFTSSKMPSPPRPPVTRPSVNRPPVTRPPVLRSPVLRPPVARPHPFAPYGHQPRQPQNRRRAKYTTPSRVSHLRARTFHYVTTVKQLDGHLKFFASEKHVSLDCKGTVLPGGLTYLALASLDRTISIDILAILNDPSRKDASKATLPLSLVDFLESPDIVKIAHDARNDSEALFAQFGIKLDNVFDTTVANLFDRRRRNLDLFLFASIETGAREMSGTWGGTVNQLPTYTLMDPDGKSSVIDVNAAKRKMQLTWETEGREKVWGTSPLSPYHQKYAVLNALLALSLFYYYRRTWAQEIREPAERNRFITVFKSVCLHFLLARDRTQPKNSCIDEQLRQRVVWDEDAMTEIPESDRWSSSWNWQNFWSQRLNRNPHRPRGVGRRDQKLGPRRPQGPPRVFFKQFPRRQQGQGAQQQQTPLPPIPPPLTLAGKHALHFPNPLKFPPFPTLFAPTFPFQPLPLPASRLLNSMAPVPAQAAHPDRAPKNGTAELPSETGAPRQGTTHAGPPQQNATPLPNPLILPPYLGNPYFAPLLWPFAFIPFPVMPIPKPTGDTGTSNNAVPPVPYQYPSKNSPSE